MRLIYLFRKKAHNIYVAILQTKNILYNYEKKFNSTRQLAGINFLPKMHGHSVQPNQVNKQQ